VGHALIGPAVSLDRVGIVRPCLGYGYATRIEGYRNFPVDDVRYGAIEQVAEYGAQYRHGSLDVGVSRDLDLRRDSLAQQFGLPAAEHFANDFFRIGG